MNGAAAAAPGGYCGLRCATYSSRKSNQRLKVSGSSESMCRPLVKVNHLRLVLVKRSARFGQWAPVCSSLNWQAMKTGTLILLTNVAGESGFATLGRK